MTVRLRPQVFVRHADDESLVVCLRTGGCTVLSGARPFLSPIDSTPRDWEEIVREIAAAFACPPADIAEDARAILDELVAQGFVECADDGACADGANGVVADGQENAVTASDKQGGSSGENESDVFPVGDFYARHRLIASLHLDLTDRCNERCVHCYIPKGGGAVLPTELAFKVLRELRAAEGLSVFVSGGECLLHPDITAILREARRLGLNIVVLSNLAACDGETIALLKEVDPQFVNVSLYSMDETEHDAITRSPGSWRKTIDAIRALQEAGVPVRLATPILRENRDAVDALVAFADTIRSHEIFDCDIIGRIDHDCSNQSHALSSKEMEDVIRRHRSRLCPPPRPAAVCRPEAKVCDIGVDKICVNAHGDYYPCDGFHGMVLGNVSRDSLEDVWRGERMERLRALRNGDFPKCVRCENRAWCKVCAMRNFNETGDMFKPAAARCAFAATMRKVWEEG